MLLQALLVGGAQRGQRQQVVELATHQIIDALAAAE